MKDYPYLHSLLNQKRSVLKITLVAGVIAFLGGIGLFIFHLISQEETFFSGNTPLIFSFAGILWIVGYFMLLKVFEKQDNKSIAKMSPSALASIDSQIQNGLAYVVPGLNVYLTRDYIVDIGMNVDFIAYSQIVSVEEGIKTGDKGKKFYGIHLVLKGQEGPKFIGSSNQNVPHLRQQCIEEIKRRCEF